MQLPPSTSSDRASTPLRRRLATVVVTVMAAAAVLIAPPAAAAVTAAGGEVNAGSFTVTGGSVSPDPAATGTHNSIAISGRTLLDFSSFNLAAGNRLDINVASRSDVVVIRIPSGSPAQVNGFLNVTIGTAASPSTPAIGEVPTNVGGNVWFIAPTGIAFGGTARVNAGGLLATTSNLGNDSDFLSGDTSISFAGGPGASATVAPLAQISVTGGLLALVAPEVVQNGTVDDPAGAGAKSDVLFGAAEEFTLTFQPDPASDLDLLGWTVPEGGLSSAVMPLSLAGTTTAGNVYLVSDSSNAGAAGPVVNPGATVRARGAVAGGDGSVLVVSGGGVDIASRRAMPRDGAAAQPISLHASLEGAFQTVVTASGDLTIHPGSVLTGQLAVLSTGGTLSNPGGAGTVASSGRWLVYAPTPANVLGVGLDSGTTAVWGSDLAGRPPATVPGTRYVFAQPRTLTFTSLDGAKVFPDVFTAFAFANDGAEVFHDGIAGLFSADTEASVFSGTPILTSPGAPAAAKELAGGGTYPIDIDVSSLVSLSGYHLVDDDAGRLTVDDTTPPGIAPSVVGTAGTDPWLTSDVTLSWDVSDPGSETVTPGEGCDTRVLTIDHSATRYTCAATSLGGANTGEIWISRDAAVPTLTITGQVGPTGAQRSYASGTWTNEDVAVTFVCTDATSGVDEASVPANRTVTAEGTTSFAAICEDNAGNTSAVVPFAVTIDRTDPAVSLPTARTPDDASYGFGSWTSQDVTVSWDCTDAGGSGAVAQTVTVPLTSTTTVTPVCVDRAGNSAEGDPVRVNIDKVAPVLHDVPADMLLHTMGGSAVATWTDPTATDDQTQFPTVTCAPGSGSSFAVGVSTVTCTATDLAGNATAASFAVRVGRLAVTFDRPVDPAPVMNVAKVGRVIPVKAVVTVDGVPVTGSSALPVSLGVGTVSCSSGGTTDTVETYGAAGSANTGNLFRWDPTADRWAYNLDTGALGMKADACYRVALHVGGSVSGGRASGGSLAGFIYLQPKR